MEVISAIATPSGVGGVAIIRMSGEGALSIARKMFSHGGGFVPNVLYPGTIDCGSFTDYGMCVYFRAPKSFTGEDTVEFHCHGGREIAAGVLRRTFALGARAAERGEFTRRAYLNGKLSLSAAEGMAEMISACSEAHLRAGYALYTEKLTEEGKRLQSLLTECLAEVDADVDFPEEDLEALSREAVYARLGIVSKGLDALLAQYGVGRKIKAGVNVVLCGKPNAGKSSLLNALLGYDRAIVSPAAGTTRDTVDGSIEIEGVLFRLTDTAGLRSGESEEEEEGVRRARKAIESADLILWLKEDDELSFPDVPVIVLSAKCDLKRGTGLNVSAVTGEGLEELKREMFRLSLGEGTDGVLLLTERHRRAIQDARTAVLRAMEAVSGGLYPDLYAQDIAEAREALGQISGETASEEVVQAIFEKFCVGK